ncbi:MAG: SDR family oxidoreductase [Halieaceae bacterium]|jgi:NAD(P)-dependent dehydrogenase (short-subunit alcohol dehydrogenase family)|nr:SDR family oxidoreductase [Halieaceae bacterium]
MSRSITGFKPDQIVLITAGASGIGRCIAERFLAQDCLVHVCDISQQSIDEFLSANPQATASVADVSLATDVDQLFAEFEAIYDRLDVLVNNAGIAGPTAAVEDISIQDWNATIAVDLNGPFYVTRLAVPLLKRGGGGSIINIASNAGLFGCPLRSAYTAAKWAVVGLTKTWSMELGEHGIRVNALCPGSVNGPRIEAVIDKDAVERGLESDAVRAVYQRQSSMRLFVDAKDVANMALFLSSDLGATISGQAIGIDGHTEGLSNWL